MHTLSAEVSGFRHRTKHLTSQSIILIPLGTTLLSPPRPYLLPKSLTSLPNVVRIILTGKSAPDSVRSSLFTVLREIVYNALRWLCRHNEDYRYHRPWRIHEVATRVRLLDSIGRTRNTTDEDTCRSDFATENIYYRHCGTWRGSPFNHICNLGYKRSIYFIRYYVDEHSLKTTSPLIS